MGRKLREIHVIHSEDIGRTLVPRLFGRFLAVTLYCKDDDKWLIDNREKRLLENIVIYLACHRNGCLCNRDFDDALFESTDILTSAECCVVVAAFYRSTLHISREVGKERPDARQMIVGLISVNSKVF